MKRLALPLAVVLIAACSSAPKAQERDKVPSIKTPSLSGYSSEPGSSPVGVIPTALLHDGQRNKDVDVAISYPSKGTGPFPLIIFSHGYGASNLAYESLAAYWTTYGYVVIRPRHADAGQLRDAALEEMLRLNREHPQQPRRGQRPSTPPPTPTAPAAPPAFRPNPMEAIWDKEREPQWRERVRDVTLVMDSLDDLETRFPELKGKIDHARIGVGGHSYGAFTTMLVAGTHASGLSLGDPRMKAGLAMSPQGVWSKLGLTPDSWRDVKIPMMYMTGSLDRGTAEDQGPQWRRTAFDNSPPPDKYFVLIEGARHGSFTGSNRPDVPTDSSYTTYEPTIDPRTGREVQVPVTRTNRPVMAMPNDRNVQQSIRIISLAYWDAYLKDVPKAKEQLAKPENFGNGVELLRK